MDLASKEYTFPRHLRPAIQIAISNTQYDKWRVGAVVVRGGNIIAMGQSKLNTDPGLCDFEQIGIRDRVSVHAEESALKRCGNPRRATLYVARVGRNGKVALAKPCQKCAKLIEAHQIRRVYYTVSPDTYAVWTPSK